MKKIICIVGIDGAGKTSQLRYLEHRLKSMGYACKYSNLRLGRFRLFSYPMLLLFRFNNRRIEANHPIINNSAISILWEFLFLIDFCIFYWLANRHYYFIKNITLLFDRYIYDGLIDLSISSGNKNIHRSWIGKLLTLFFKKPDVLIFLDMKESLAMKRNKDREIHDMDYLSKRRYLYQKYVKEFDMTVIDANRSFNEVHQDIVSVVNDEKILPVNL